jgi:competence protein ComEC
MEGFLFISSLYFFKKERSFLFHAVVFLLYFWTGLLWFQLEKELQGPANLSALLKSGVLNLAEPCRIIGTCLGGTVRGNSGEQYTIRLEYLENGRRTFSPRGKIRLSYYYPASLREGNSVNKELPPFSSSSAETGQLSPSISSPVRTSPLLEGGGRVEILARLKPPGNFRNDGAFNAVANLERQGIYLVGSIKDPRLITVLPQEPGVNGRRTITWIRSRLLNRIDSLFGKNPEVASMLRALLLGEKNSLPPHLREEFQATGTYHVLVISGQHAAILAACLFGIVRLLHVPRAGQFLVICGFLGAYSLLAEGQPSIVRATVMTAAFLTGWLLDRGRNGLNSLCLACLGLLLANSCWLMDAGFQLSFLAVLSIFLFGVPLLEHATLPAHSALLHLETPDLDSRFSPILADFRISLRTKAEKLWESPAKRQIGLALICLPFRMGLYLADTFLISLSVQLLFFILMLGYFNRISLSSLLVNLISVPLVGLIVPLGYLVMAFSFLIPWAAHPLQAVLSQLCQLLLGITHFFSSATWGNFRSSDPALGILAVNLASLTVFGIFAKNKRVRRIGISGWLLSTAGLLFSPWFPRTTGSRLSFTMLDVHQGDAMVIELPRGKTMLLDGGGLPGKFPAPDFLEDTFDIGENVLAPFLWSRGINQIDYLVATHPHHDHVGGLFFMVENFRVGEIWTPNRIKNTILYPLVQKALQRGIRWRGFVAGDHAQLGEISISCLNPRPEGGTSSLQPDDDSLVFLLNYRHRSFLLTADAGKKTEEELIRSRPALRADLLKVAHHGSRSASSPPFLRKIAPACALISVGLNNPFQHPHPEVLTRLQQTGAEVLRTDRLGAIRVITNGRNIAISTYADEHPGL